MRSGRSSGSRNNRYQIHLALIQKYHRQFNRFRAGPINYIIYNYSYSPYTLDFKDSALLSNDQQFMRRYYRLLTPDGHSQIHDRVYMMAQHYHHRQNAISFEYPTMFVTGTEKTFKARQRMKRKMKPIDLSSMMQGSSSSSNKPSKTELLLKSLNKSPLSSYESSSICSDFIKSIYVDSDKSKSESVYDIYHQEPSSFSAVSEKSGQVKKIKESQNMTNLILDFDQIDQQYLQKQIALRDKVRTNKIPSSIQIFSINQEEPPSYPAYHQPTSPINENQYRFQAQENKRKEIRAHLRDKYINKHLNNKPKDLQQTQRNKGLIKKKAENLLRRLQVDDYGNYTLPYDD